MNSELTRTDQTAPATYSRHVTPNAPNPLMLVPADWRESVAVLWTTNAHLLPSALALCARLRLYASEHAITADDIRRIVHTLTQPERAATHRFASDLLADVAVLIAETVRRRKAQQDAEARRLETAGPLVGRQIAAGLFPDPTQEEPTR